LHRAGMMHRFASITKSCIAECCRAEPASSNEKLDAHGRTELWNSASRGE